MRLVAALDPWWLTVIGVSLGSLLVLSGWPDQAGPVSDGLMVGLVVALGTGLLAYATQQAESQLLVNELRSAERRQTSATQLALSALTRADLPLVMQEATTLVATSLDVEYCAILETRATDSALMLRAGFGWPEGSLGRPVMAAMPASPMRSGSQCSDTPAPWQRGHTVRSSISVGLEVDQHLYGVLDIYTSRERVFSREEAAFIQTVADILGAAIERDQANAARHMREAEVTYRVGFRERSGGRPSVTPTARRKSP